MARTASIVNVEPSFTSVHGISQYLHVSRDEIKELSCKESLECINGHHTEEHNKVDRIIYELPSKNVKIVTARKPLAIIDPKRLGGGEFFGSIMESHDHRQSVVAVDRNDSDPNSLACGELVGSIIESHAHQQSVVAVDRIDSSVVEIADAMKSEDEKIAAEALLILQSGVRIRNDHVENGVAMECNDDLNAAHTLLSERSDNFIQHEPEVVMDCDNQYGVWEASMDMKQLEETDNLEGNEEGDTSIPTEQSRHEQHQVDTPSIEGLQGKKRIPQETLSFIPIHDPNLQTGEKSAFTTVSPRSKVTLDDPPQDTYPIGENLKGKRKIEEKNFISTLDLELKIGFGDVRAPKLKRRKVHGTSTVISIPREIASATSMQASPSEAPAPQPRQVALNSSMQIPRWLEHFVSLGSTFHENVVEGIDGCYFHRDPNLAPQNKDGITKRALKYYCKTCEQGPVCQFGVEERHSGHEILQTRIASHRTAVQFKDIEAMDESINYNHIMPFVINNKTVLFIDGRLQPKKPRGAKYLCKLCERSLSVGKENINNKFPAEYRGIFCSIGCKLRFLRTDNIHHHPDMTYLENLSFMWRDKGKEYQNFEDEGRKMTKRKLDNDSNKTNDGEESNNDNNGEEGESNDGNGQAEKCGDDGTHGYDIRSNNNDGHRTSTYHGNILGGFKEESNDDEEMKDGERSKTTHDSDISMRNKSMKEGLFQIESSKIMDDDDKIDLQENNKVKHPCHTTISKKKDVDEPGTVAYTSNKRKRENIDDYDKDDLPTPNIDIQYKDDLPLQNIDDHNKDDLPTQKWGTQKRRTIVYK